MKKTIKLIGIISLLITIVLIPMLLFIKYDVLGNCTILKNSYKPIIILNDSCYKKLKNKKELIIINNKEKIKVDTVTNWDNDQKLKIWYCYINKLNESVFLKPKIILNKKNIFGF